MENEMETGIIQWINEFKVSINHGSLYRRGGSDNKDSTLLVFILGTCLEIPRNSHMHKPILVSVLAQFSSHQHSRRLARKPVEFIGPLKGEMIFVILVGILLVKVVIV